jgi:hypothetical protein
MEARTTRGSNRYHHLVQPWVKQFVVAGRRNSETGGRDAELVIFSELHISHHIIIDQMISIIFKKW